VAQEFKGKRVLLVDDSIVRGTTSREIVEMARAAGALKVYFASASPPVRYPECLRHRHADARRTDRDRPHGRGNRHRNWRRRLVYQDLDALKASIRDLKPALCHFDTSCFDGSYVTGDVSIEYLTAIETAREVHRATTKEERWASKQLQLNLMSAG
jgi:amidophosphoribosyltransferase